MISGMNRAKNSRMNRAGNIGATQVLFFRMLGNIGKGDLGGTREDKSISR